MADYTVQLARCIGLLFGSVLLVLVFAAKYKHQDFLNRSVISVVVGALSGLVFRHVIAPANGIDMDAWHRNVVADISAETTLQPIMFLLFYPYLYWPSGWFARVDYLFYYLDWVVLMAVGPFVSTLTTTILVDSGHYWWRSLFYSADLLEDYPLYLRDIYLSSACVSIIDPTPMLFAMGDINTPPAVSVTVLWESLAVPDVSTLIVNRASIPELEMSELNLRTVIALCKPDGLLWNMVLPSIFAGMLVGFCICALLRTRWLKSRPSWEAIFIIISPFFAHAVVSAAGLWAILADMPCGVVMSKYGRHQISNEGLRQADTAVTQVTILICTLYYVFVAAYFTTFSNGLGSILGVWLFFCSIVGRFATVAICLPVSSAIRWVQYGRSPEDNHRTSIENRINRFKLGLLLFGGQTRGGVWFAWYFSKSFIAQKEMVIDAVLTTWFCSQITFGVVPRKIYMWTGLPHGAASEDFTFHQYDAEWYRRVALFKPALWLHEKILKTFFSLDSDHNVDEDDGIDPGWQKGNRWMGTAGVLPRNRASFDCRVVLPASLEMVNRRTTWPLPGTN